MSMVSTPSRRKLASHAPTRWYRDDPIPFGPSSMRNVALLEISTRLRFPVMALPRISSDMPFEYTSAVSKRFTPASRQMSTSRVASATSELPQALKNSLPPPNVPVPKERTGTSKPDEPNCLYSIAQSMLSLFGLRGEEPVYGFTDADPFYPNLNPYRERIS